MALHVPIEKVQNIAAENDVKLIHKSQIIHQVIAAKLDHLGDIVVYHPAALFLMKIIDYHTGIQTHLNFELVIQSALCLGYGDRRQVGTDNLISQSPTLSSLFLTAMAIE